MSLIERLYARPPLSWIAGLYDLLTRPINRRRERRRAKLAAEFQALADTLKAAGLADTARVLHKHAEKLSPKRPVEG